MPGRDDALRIAQRIAADIEREFGHTKVEVEPVPIDRDGEADAYLWLDSTGDADDAEEVWDWTRYVCNLAWQQEDVNIVWRWKRNRAGMNEDDDE